MGGVQAATFDRENDWLDVATVVYACDEPLDYGSVRDRLDRIDGPGGHRLAPVRAGGGPAPARSRRLTTPLGFDVSAYTSARSPGAPPDGGNRLRRSGAFA